MITSEATLNTGFSAVRVRSSNYFAALDFTLVTWKVQLRMVPFGGFNCTMDSGKIKAGKRDDCIKSKINRNHFTCL